MADPPRVLVIGAGSSGARHTRNLAGAAADVTVTDPDGARARSLPDARAIAFDLDRIDGFDGIVIASPTSAHARQTEAALATGARLLVEKPLAMSAAEGQAAVDGRDDQVMVAFNLRFHEPVARAVELVHEGAAGRVSSMRVWFGSWLPDWRPAVDYRRTYSAQRALGGGVLLDAVHELDLLVWLLDERLSVDGARVDRLGPLEIDVEDTVHAILRHEDGVAITLSLDYLSRSYRRGIEVIGDRATVRLDWARKVIEVEDAEARRKEPADAPVERSYEQQARCFVNWIGGTDTPPVNGTTALASLRLLDAIREAAQ